MLKRSWAGEVHNVSLLVAIGVNGEGYREILGICEGAIETWRNRAIDGEHPIQASEMIRPTPGMISGHYCRGYCNFCARALSARSIDHR